MKTLTTFQKKTNWIGSDKTLYTIVGSIVAANALFYMLPYSLELSLVLASMIMGLSVLLMLIAGTKAIISVALFAYAVYYRLTNREVPAKQVYTGHYTLLRVSGR